MGNNDTLIAPDPVFNWGKFTFEIPKSVPLTDDSKAVSALPEFDINSSVPEDSIQNQNPKDTVKGPNPELDEVGQRVQNVGTELTNFFNRIGLQSSVAIHTVRNLFPSALTKAEEDSYVLKNSDSYPTKVEGENFDSYNKRVEEFYKPFDKEQIAKGPLGQLDTEMNLAMAVAAPEMKVKDWATFIGAMGLMEGEDAVQKKFAPNIPEGINNLIKIGTMAASFKFSHEAVKGVSDYIGNVLMKSGNQPVVDLSTDHLEAITQSKSISDSDKTDLLDKLGVTQDHIDVAKASNLPVRVSVSSLLDMSSSDIWPKIDNEFKLKGEQNANQGGESTQSGGGQEGVEGQAQTGVHLRNDAQGGMEIETGTELENTQKDIQDISDQLGYAEGPQTIVSDEGKYSRLKSGWPSYLTDRGYTRKELNNIFNKFMRGDKLTDKQQKKLDSILTDYRSIKSNISDISDAKDDNELKSLREHFPNITDEEISALQKEVDDEWSDNKLQDAIKKYTSKKVGEKEGKGSNVSGEEFQSDNQEIGPKYKTMERLYKIQPSWEDLKQSKEEIEKANKAGADLIAKILPQLKDSISNPAFLYTKEGEKALGMYFEGKIDVVTGKGLNVYLHEAGHAVLDMFLTPDEKTNLLSEFKKAYPLSEDPEEELMLRLENYAAQKEIIKEGKLTGKVIDFFNTIIERVRRLFGINQDKVKDFYDKLLEGGFSKEDQLKEYDREPRYKEDEDKNEYVKNEPFNPEMGKNDKEASKSMREEYSGIKQSQVVRGNQLADNIRKTVPEKTERQGIFWYKAAKGNLDLLAEALNDEKFKDYHDQIEKALNLSPKSLEALDMVNKYYDEAGQVSSDIGTIKNIRDNYMNRIYEPEPPKDYIKNELKAGIKQTTSHALQRVYDTEFEAVANGKKFAVTDVSDALAIHNEEMARVNTARKMANYLVDNNLAAWKKEDNVPTGWQQVGNMVKRVPLKDKEGNPIIGEDSNQVISKSILVAPKGISDGLKAITDPDFLKQFELVRKIQKFQGLVKTVDLSFSLFHHLSLTGQSLYQGGFMDLMKTPVMDKLLDSKEFGEMEQDFVRHTGMTTKVEENQDILRKLVSDNPKTFSEKITNIPGVKQALEASQKNSQWLFGRLQRYLKVTDYQTKMSNWISKHPEASNAEVKSAKIGYSKEINNAYGGQNWEARGITKTHLSLMRLLLLAPDWTISNLSLGKDAAMDWKSTSGGASRANLATALIGGMLLTEGLNQVMTGHFTDENKKGHQFEVEVSPDVYVSLLRGGIGDLIKLTSMTADSGAIGGPTRFLQGKGAPLARTAVGILSGTKYTGVPISKKKENALEKTIDYLAYSYQSAGPQPFGVSNLADYLMHEREQTLGGGIGVGIGAARYSQSGKRK